MMRPAGRFGQLGRRRSRHSASALLNHAAGPVTAAYDHHDYLPQKAAALQKWADALDQITGATPSNVVPMAARR